MSQIDLDRLAEVLKLTPEQRAQLETAARAAQVGSTPEPRPQLEVEVQLTPAATLRGEGKKSAQEHLSHQDQFVAGLAARVPPELRKRLVEIEPQVLRWIGARRENALRFTTDPLGALRSAVPDLDEKTLAALAALRGGHPQVRPDLPGMDLVSVRVGTKPAPRRKS